MLEDFEKNLEEYWKAIELKDKQLAEVEKVLQGAKKSYDSVVQGKNYWKSI